MIWSNQAKYIIHTCTLYILNEISCMQFYNFVNFIKKKNVSTTLISRGSSLKLAIFTMGSYWKTLNFHVFPIFCIATLGIYGLFLCFFPDNGKEHTAGLTGQQKMLTPHLIIPCCSALFLYFVLRIFLRCLTVFYCHFALLHDLVQYKKWNIVVYIGL